MEYSVTWTDARPEPGAITSLQDKAWFSTSSPDLPINYWQLGPDLPTSGAERFNAVYACRKVLAEEVSRLHAHHWREDDSGGRTRLNSRLERLLRYPNPWQSRVDFWLNLMDRLLCNGNAYALAGRDQSGAITSLTPIANAHPYVDPVSGAIFYALGVNSHDLIPPAAEIPPDRMVAHSEIFHLRLFTPIHPLIGEPPLNAARISAGSGLAMSSSTFSFFNRAARPSGYLVSKLPRMLTPEETEKLKKQWNDSYSGNGIGGTAILPADLEWHPMTMTAVDAEIVDLYKLTVEDVARVYRVPLFMLGDMTKATFTNVEQMTRTFYAGGLGFYLEHIESQLARFFDLAMVEHVEFDVEQGLMRAELKDRVDALAKGVQGGIFSPNEARRREGLPAVPAGDNVFLQSQMVAVEQAASENEPPPQDDPIGPEEIRAFVRAKMNKTA